MVRQANRPWKLLKMKGKRDRYPQITSICLMCVTSFPTLCQLGCSWHANSRIFGPRWQPLFQWLLGTFGRVCNITASEGWPRYFRHHHCRCCRRWLPGKIYNPDVKIFILIFNLKILQQIVCSNNRTYSTDVKALGKGDFTSIPHGINGIEDRLSVVWQKIVQDGKKGMERLKSCFIFSRYQVV